LSNDLETLKGFDHTTLFLSEGETHNHTTKKGVKVIEAKEYNEIVTKGYNELIVSLEKRTSDEKTKAELLAKGDKTIVASVAQTEAYDHIGKGLKAKDGLLYIYGLMVKKTVLQKGDYPTKFSQAKTIVKDKIKDINELRDTKYKQFKLGELETLKIQGVEI